MKQLPIEFLNIIQFGILEFESGGIDSSPTSWLSSHFPLVSVLPVFLQLVSCVQFIWFIYSMFH